MRSLGRTRSITNARKGKPMKQHLIALSTVLAFAFAGAAGAAGNTGMTKDAHNAAKDKIEAQAKADKKACDAMKENAKDICQAEAKAKEKIAKAELEAQYKPSPRNDEKVKLMKAEVDYEVAKEKCEDQKADAMTT